jgi:Predicted redox protein, regulator of disulfide bond formation
MVHTMGINGVAVDQLMQLVEAVKAQPEMGKVTFRAENQWATCAKSCTTIDDFIGAGSDNRKRTEKFRLLADEPPVLLGEDTAPNPVEFILHALCTCLTTTTVYQAASRGIQIESLSSKMEGDLDLRGFMGLAPDVRKGYQELRVSFTVKSQADAEQLKELMQFSPVLDIIRNPVPVTITVQTL